MPEVMNYKFGIYSESYIYNVEPLLPCDRFVSTLCIKFKDTEAGLLSLLLNDKLLGLCLLLHRDRRRIVVLQYDT